VVPAQITPWGSARSMLAWTWAGAVITVRAAGRLWVLLHAQALLRGTAGGRDDAAVIEDDCRRLAGWRRT